MKYVCILVAFTTLATHPNRLLAEGCLGPVPVMARVFAIDAKTGTAKELLKVKEEMVSRPAVRKDSLFIGVGNKVVCIAVPSGKNLWSFEASYTVYDIKPTEDAIYCGAGSTLYALDAKAGKPIWTFQSKGGVSDFLLFEDQIVFHSNEGLRSVDRKTGKERWKSDFRWDNFVLSPMCKDRVCAWMPDQAHVVDVKTGKDLWQVGTDWKPGNPGRYPIATIANPAAIFRVGDDPDDLNKWFVEAVDPKARKTIWRNRFDLKVGAPTTQRELNGKLLLCSEGKLGLLDGETGKVHWKTDLGAASVDAHQPVFDDASLYLSDHTGTVWALDIKTGKERWKRDGGKPGKGLHFHASDLYLEGDMIYLTVNETMNR